MKVDTISCLSINPPDLHPKNWTIRNRRGLEISGLRKALSRGGKGTRGDGNESQEKGYTFPGEMIDDCQNAHESVIAQATRYKIHLPTLNRPCRQRLGRPLPSLDTPPHFAAYKESGFLLNPINVLVIRFSLFPAQKNRQPTVALAHMGCR